MGQVPSRNFIWLPFTPPLVALSGPSNVVKSHLIKRGFKKSYTIWTTHGEIDDALLEVDTERVGDDNSHDQDDGVFDGDDPGIDDDDDDFDYEELLCHIEPHVLNSMGTDRGLDNMEIIEKSSREPLYDESNGCGKDWIQMRVMLELLKLKAAMDGLTIVSRNF
jgi:hypothetical protein